ncbi:MAG: RluA family pseudouridine synthase [Clostridia bacterium]|nr:RluA family pseudouridine synthase [Clostridia bacterium]
MTTTAGDNENGKRLDVAVAGLTGKTRSSAQSLIDGGGVTVNGKTPSKSYRVVSGDRIEIVIPEPAPSKAVAQEIVLDVVYEDDDVIVVNKPKGMVVHPAAGNPDGTLVNALLYHCGDSLSGIGGVMRPGIVHRIDKETSGLIVAAKNDFSHSRLAAQIKEHKVVRIYHAVAVGRFGETDGTVDAPIGRNPRDRKKMAVVAEHSRNAISHFHVLRQYPGFTYISVALETGRTHQIRVHMSHIGHPLAGDTVYGGGRTDFEKKNSSVLHGQCLHAKELSFEHPRTGREMRFTTDLPDYFSEILAKLEKTSLE